MARIVILGAPLEEGAGRPGCRFGPAALRVAGLAGAIEAAGHAVTDLGDVRRLVAPPRTHPNPSIKALAEVTAWTGAIDRAVAALPAGTIPVILGGDHGIAAGSLPALERRARAAGRPLFVLWLDAHADFHTLATTDSGNLHGVPLAYATGQGGFDGFYPPNPAPVSPERVCLLGLRSVDPAERAALSTAGIAAHDMAALRRRGAIATLRDFLAEVIAHDGLLHVTLDVDFLDPAIAPGVGTRVAHGPDARTAFAMMRTIAASGCLASFELAELNPLLDETGQTARLLVALTATALAPPDASAARPTPHRTTKDSRPCVPA